VNPEIAGPIVLGLNYLYIDGTKIQCVVPKKNQEFGTCQLLDSSLYVIYAKRVIADECKNNLLWLLSLVVIKRVIDLV